MPKRPWSLAIGEEPQEVSLGGRHGTLELRSCSLLSGDRASLFCTAGEGSALALASAAERRPHCLVSGLFDGPVRLCSSGGTLLLSGLLHRRRRRRLKPLLAPSSSLPSSSSSSSLRGLGAAPGKRTRALSRRGQASEADARRIRASKPRVSFAGAEARVVSYSLAAPAVSIGEGKLKIVTQAKSRAKDEARDKALARSVALALARASPKAKAKAAAARAAAAKAAARATARSPGTSPSGRHELAGGLAFERLGAGKGPPASVGSTVQVRYEGKLAKNGRRFDKGVIKFRLGRGEVIQGWDEGVKGMLRGERRRLLVPAKMGYGQQGAPPFIPRNADLIFDVELVQC